MNETNEAIAAYEEAFAGSVSGVEYDAVWASMLAAEVAKDRALLAATFLEKGAVAAQTTNVCTPLITAKVLLELGLARWLAGLNAWHKPLLEGIALLLFEREDSKEWRSVVTRVSHSIGYIVSKVVHGRELTKTGDGSPYAKPWIGIFRASDAGAAKVYSSEREAAVAAHAVTLSHYFGDREQASRFARYTLDLSYDRNDFVSAAGLSNIAGYLLAEDLVEDVLAVAFEVGARIGHSPADTTLDEHWRPGDCSMALFGFVPVVLRIAFRLAEDRATGISFLKRACSAFLQWERDSRSGKPWLAVVNAIEASANGRSSLQEDGKAVGLIKGWAASIIHHGCILLMSVHPKATSKDAADLQALTLPTLWKLLEHDCTSQDLLLSEFVQTYWQRALENDACRFNAPAEVSRRFERAAASSWSGHRIAGILEAVWESMRTAVPAETRSWLASLKAQHVNS